MESSRVEQRLWVSLIFLARRISSENRIQLENLLMANTLEASSTIDRMDLNVTQIQKRVQRLEEKKLELLRRKERLSESSESN